jgi:hypothetical protein
MRRIRRSCWLSGAMETFRKGDRSSLSLSGLRSLSKRAVHGGARTTPACIENNNNNNNIIIIIIIIITTTTNSYQLHDICQILPVDPPDKQTNVFCRALAAYFFKKVAWQTFCRAQFLSVVSSVSI